jgi:phospholipid/cholesterol/gamma-HCH transport system substrate-binding protein
LIGSRRPNVARAATLLVVAAVALSGCSFGGSSGRTDHAMFTRAIQLFPAGRVRVLGVNVGHIDSIRNTNGGVEVTFEIDSSDIQLPRDVQAAIVPASLLGERYVQLFPAYSGGPTLPNGATIPESRTAVPVEPDEVLRSLQDYLGAIDPNTVTRFVENAATILRGNGQDLNTLIEHGARVMETLSSKRDDLANLITQLDTLTKALSTRQQAIGDLIQTYDVVGRTLNDNRTSLEGTIEGLNEASAQLASLLLAHQSSLNTDIDALTRTSRTLQKNVGHLANTGHYATLLFRAASRAVDFDHNWLRLGNQGQELGALILLRLEERLQMLCLVQGQPQCVSSNFWSQQVPQLFCFKKKCPPGNGSAVSALAAAIDQLPRVRDAFAGASNGATLTQSEGASAGDGGGGNAALEDMVSQLLDQTVGNTDLGTGTGG